MTNFLLKLIVYPILLIIVDLLFTNFSFSYLYQPIIIGLSLGILITFFDWALVYRGTLWIATFSDLIISFLVIYFGSLFFANAYVSTTGSIIAAIVIAIYEYFAHIWLIRHDTRTEISYR